MAKLPKSSRPTRRKPSETSNHPYQRNIFAPPLASSMSEVGVVARITIGLFVPLIFAYLANSNTLPDDSQIKGTYYVYAGILTAIAALLAVIEFMRTMRMFDTERLGRYPKYALLSLTLLGAACLFAGIANLVYLHSQAHEQRLQETIRREQERLRKEQEKQSRDKEVEAECNALKVKDVDALTKRRNAAFAEHKKCITEYVKPNMFSNETAEQYCAPKKSTQYRLDQDVKERQAKNCSVK